MGLFRGVSDHPHSIQDLDFVCSLVFSPIPMFEFQQEVAAHFGEQTGQAVASWVVRWCRGHQRALPCDNTAVLGSPPSPLSSLTQHNALLASITPPRHSPVARPQGAGVTASQPIPIGATPPRDGGQGVASSAPQLALSSSWESLPPATTEEDS